jgi:hypothetical protein
MTELLAISTLIAVLVLLYRLNAHVIPFYSIACLAVGWVWWIFPILALGVQAASTGRLHALGMLLTVLSTSAVCAVLCGRLGRHHDPLEFGAYGGMAGLLLGGLLASQI